MLGQHVQLGTRPHGVWGEEAGKSTHSPFPPPNDNRDKCRNYNGLTRSNTTFSSIRMTSFASATTALAAIKILTSPSQRHPQTVRRRQDRIVGVSEAESALGAQKTKHSSSSYTTAPNAQRSTEDPVFSTTLRRS